ncbi:MAG: carbon-nitrogen hydrolase [Bacillota bacterium]
MTRKPIKVSLIQVRCTDDTVHNLERTIQLVRQASQDGAHIICLQELFQTLYFPQRVEVDKYRLAEPVPGPTTERMRALAEELGVVLLVPLYEYAMAGVYFNTCVVVDADGKVLGKMRKCHIPEGPQYFEKYYFTPGDLGYPVFHTRYGRIGVGICWDEWFPEVARILTLKGAEIVFYPSAIGSEPDRPGFDSREPWETVMRGHAIANGIYVAAVNRVGTEAGMSFYGGSFIADPLGNVLARGSTTDECIVSAEVDLSCIRETRDLFQFLRDRRVDTYRDILRIMGACGVDS